MEILHKLLNSFKFVNTQHRKNSNKLYSLDTKKGNILAISMSFDFFFITTVRVYSISLKLYKIIAQIDNCTKLS